MGEINGPSRFFHISVKGLAPGAGGWGREGGGGVRIKIRPSQPDNLG